MTRKRQVRAWLAVFSALGLAAAANGCEIIANFDRSLIPAEGGFDAAYSLDGFGEIDGETDAAVDTSVPPADSSVQPDSGTADSTAPIDSSTVDSTTPKDSSTADTSVADTSVADTSVADTSTADTSAPEDASDDGG